MVQPCSLGQGNWRSVGGPVISRIAVIGQCLRELVWRQHSYDERMFTHDESNGDLQGRQWRGGSD